MNFDEKSLKLETDPGERVVNQAIVVDLKVEGNILHFTTSEATPITIFVLKYKRWSFGSVLPL